MKVTQMSPVHAANVAADCGNTAYGVEYLRHTYKFIPISYGSPDNY